MHSNFTLKNIERLPESEALITGEINLPFLVESRIEALKELSEKVELPGFRKGKIPENILIRELSEMRILEEAAEIAMAKLYEEIIKESKLSPLGRPEVSITKLAPGIPLEFKMKVYLEPEVELPDYHSIASKINKEELEKVEVNEEEVKGLIEELKKRNINPELKEGESLEEKIKENILLEKEMQKKEKRRLQIMEELVKTLQVSVPKNLIEAELGKMLGQFKDDVSRMGMKWDEYLKRAEKTESEIKEEWRDKALERVKAELLVAKIAEKEKIEPDEHELEHETAHLLHHYPDADPLRARIYVYTHIRTQKVFEFLESIGERKESKVDKNPPAGGEKPKKSSKPKPASKKKK